MTELKPTIPRTAANFLALIVTTSSSYFALYSMESHFDWSGATALLTRLVLFLIIFNTTYRALARPLFLAIAYPGIHGSDYPVARQRGDRNPPTKKELLGMLVYNSVGFLLLVVSGVLAKILLALVN